MRIYRLGRRVTSKSTLFKTNTAEKLLFKEIFVKMEFTTSEDGSNITYIQYINPNDAEGEPINFIIPNNTIFKQEQNEGEEIFEETLEEYEGDTETMDVEVLESVVNIGKKFVPVKTEEVTKQLVQISDSNKAT